jgi:acetoin utilization deacetylase AcuC-like enzyme
VLCHFLDVKPLLVSAGFDAAAGDPLGECLVSPAGYAHMTHMLCGLANGKVVVALEVCIRTHPLRH